MILILALKKYLPITANKKVAIKVITIYINAVIEKILRMMARRTLLSENALTRTPSGDFKLLLDLIVGWRRE